MAVDLAGTITYLKDHAIEHGFHVHDERHFIETYSLRQSFEVDMHPEGMLKTVCSEFVDAQVPCMAEAAIAQIGGNEGSQ